MGASCSGSTACGGVTMSDERHEIRLREAVSGSPPDLLDKIKDAIENLFDCSVYAAGGYIKGKSDQEVAKAAEIKAKALSHLGNLELDRQRLLAERDKLLCDDKQKMYELKTKRLEAIVNSLVRLQELNVKVQIEVVTEKLIEAMEEF
jgi:hypothetical protein